jgi:L-fuconate dehydratase
MACGAIINAAWDLYAKYEGKPLWKLLADMSPEELVGAVDFHWITDALTPEEAIAMLKEQQPTKTAREAEMLRDGFPAYTTSAGWLGYSDEKIKALCEEYMAEGHNYFKMKVGSDIDDDMRRASILREAIGPDRTLMMDANQKWDVDEAIVNMKRLAKVQHTHCTLHTVTLYTVHYILYAIHLYTPHLYATLTHHTPQYNPWWIEEPTNPDDILGHAKIAAALAPLDIGVATGEVCHNRVMFKQLLQAKAIKFCQIDTCRVGGINELLAILLLAKKFNVAVCPHAGGVGLCEYVRHICVFDYIAIAGTLEDRICESTTHLHEHFYDPVRVEVMRIE